MPEHLRGSYGNLATASVAQLLPPRHLRVAVNLRQAGQARPHGVPPIETRNLFTKFCDQLIPFGPGTDEAHVTAENVPKLWEFVHRRGPQDPPQASHARVVLRGRHGPFVAVRTRNHRAKLQAVENSAVLPNPSLAVEDRPLAFEFVGQRDEPPER